MSLGVMKGISYKCIIIIIVIIIQALPLWDWLRRFRGSTSSLGCVSPPELQGRDLKELRKEELPSCSAGETQGGGVISGEAGLGESLKKEEDHRLHHRNHRHRHNHHQHPHLPHGDQHNGDPPPSPLPLPRPPKGSRRNCTRNRGRKGKGGGQGGLNEVQALREGEKDNAPGGGKHDPSAPTRRRNKCVPRTSVGPPSGVKRANSNAASRSAGTFLCVLLAVLLSLTAGILL